MSLAARIAHLAAVALLVLGCARAPAGDAAVTGPLPTSVAEAGEMKRAGAAWDNAAVRAVYLRMIAAIAPANERWKQEGIAAPERAKRAYQMRHDARLLARAMMKDAAEVAALQARDQAKYGSPDGPTFESLVEHNTRKGLAGDAIYEAIVESSQRTDQGVNELFGLK